MDRDVTMAFPRPGRALKGVLLTITIFGILESFLVNYTPIGARIFAELACSTSAVLHGRVYTLLTAGLLTRPDTIGHLIFTVIGLYFLSPDLEKRWGSWRFLRFLAISVLFGFILSVLLDKLAPPEAPRVFHPDLMYGAGAAITATAVAWSTLNARMQVRLFFFLPVSGKQLFWFTIGFCVLGLIYPGSVPEGVAAPFGGVVTGLLLGGTPSVMRTIYLRLKLGVLRQRAGGRAQMIPKETEGLLTVRRRGGASPPLRVVQGGLGDDLRKRRPPKDKRFLN